MLPYRDNIPTRRTPIVNYAIIALNCLVLFAMAQLPDERRQSSAYRFGFVPARIGQLVHGRPLRAELPIEVEMPLIGVVPMKRPLQLDPEPGEIVASWFTSMFMHGNLLHLLSNMWFLWLFGDNVEDRLGRATYVVFYVLGGLAAMTCQWLHDPHSMVPVVGASGAVAAVLGAYAVTWPHARIRTLVVLVVFVTVVELPALLFLGGWFLMQLLEGLQPQRFGMEGGVAWWAHVGGFIAGLLLMPLLSTGELPTDEAPLGREREW